MGEEACLAAMLALTMQSDARREKTRPPDHEVLLDDDVGGHGTWTTCMAGWPLETFESEDAASATATEFAAGCMTVLELHGGVRTYVHCTPDAHLSKGWAAGIRDHWVSVIEIPQAKGDRIRIPASLFDVVFSDRTNSRGSGDGDCEEPRAPCAQRHSIGGECVKTGII